MLCWGPDELKARVLYNVIYQTIQEFVVPNDRMESVFRNLITFSTILMMKHSCKEAKETDYSKTEIPLGEIDEDLIEEAIEDILESIFGTDSKMSRTSFLNKLVSKECRWILDSEQIRRRMKKYIKARNKGVSVMDQMSDS